MAELTYFKVFNTYADFLRDYTVEQYGILFKAMLDYSMYHAEPVIDDPKVQGSWPFVRFNMDEGERSYEEMIRKNSENGKKGGRPRNTPKPAKNDDLSLTDDESDPDIRDLKNPTVFLETQKSQDKDKDKYNEKDKYDDNGEGEDKDKGADAQEGRMIRLNTPSPAHAASDCSATPPDSKSDFLISERPQDSELEQLIRDYKQCRRESCNPLNCNSERALRHQIDENAQRYGPEAVKTLMRQCIQENTKGIYFDRLDRGIYGKSASTKGKNSHTVHDTPVNMDELNRVLEMIS